MKKLIQELQRRNVIKAAISYLVVAWLILQVASIVFPILGVSPVIQKWILIILAVGFPAWVVFAYIYELTPEGFKRTEDVALEESIHRDTSKKLNAYIIGGLTLVIVVLIFDRIFQVDVSFETSQIQANSLAVLPFENLSAPEDAYFARGITEDIFIQTSNVSDFKILSSYKLKDYDANDKTLKEIGEELGVSHLLLGNVRRSEDDIRIGCQLISTQEESVLWANSYHKKMANVFSLQKEIAVEIARSLVTNFDLPEKQLAEEKPTENLIAYDLYLRARDYANEFNGESQQKAVALLQEAIDLDPYFANAYAGLSSAYSLGIERFQIFDESYLDTARALAQKAIDLDPELPRAWTCLGLAYRQQGKTEQALTMYLKSNELDGQQPDVLNNLANIYGQRNEMDRAIKMYKKALSLQPANDKGASIEYSNLGWNYFYLGFYDYALACAEKAIEMREDYINAYLLRTVSHYGKGDTTASYQAFQKVVDSGSPYANGLSTISNMYYEYLDIDSGRFYMEKWRKHPDFTRADEVYANLLTAHSLISKGKVEKANVLLDDALEYYLSQMEKGIRFQGYLRSISIIYSLKGEREKAIEWLQRLIEDGYRNRIELSLTVLYDGLRDEPEFIDLMDDLQVKLDTMRQRVQDDQASEQLNSLRL